MMNQSDGLGIEPEKYNELCDVDGKLPREPEDFYPTYTSFSSELSINNKRRR